jgi:hypothetical protein
MKQRRRIYYAPNPAIGDIRKRPFKTNQADIQSSRCILGYAPFSFSLLSKIGSP